MCQCSRIQEAWNQLSARENIHFAFPDGFLSGHWLIRFRHSFHCLATIAAAAWFIWVCRCNVIFKNILPNLSVIVAKVVAHIREYSIGSTDSIGRKLIVNNFTCADGHFLFLHAISNHSTQVRSVGFIFVNSNCVVYLAGCFSQGMMDNSSDDLLALEVALQIAVNRHITVKHIFCAQANIAEFLSASDHTTIWCFQPQIDNVKFLLDISNQPKIHLIPDLWGVPAANLASLGFKHRHLNLFLFGRDLPFWIMRSMLEFGFVF